jgi:PKD repeat protein
MMRRRLLSLLLLATLAALAAPGTALAQAPSAEFDADKYEAQTNETISFTITNVDPTPGTTYSWEFGDGVTGTGENVTHSYTTASAPGTPYTVTVTASNVLGTNTASQALTVVDPPPPPPVNTKPTADFTISNNEPVVGETISLISRSTDPEDDPLRCEWTVAGSSPAVAEPGECTTTVTWTAPGPTRVTLKVTDPGSLSDTVSERITIRTLPAPPNENPNAPSLSYSPIAPIAGERVTFTGKATDPDGTIETYEWDFNSDTVYDASGETATYVFAAAGNYTVTVRATDNNGGSRTSFQTIFVSSPPAAGEILGTSNSGSPPTASTPSSGQGQPRPTTARLLSPFPVVRLRGSVVGRTARITLLSIQGAPRGAKVRVRCRGGGCPRKLVTSTARSSRRTMRLRSFERRLRAGAKLEIYITQSGRLGKYTRFEIRRNAAPRRVDRCVRSFPGKPLTCPATG